MPQLDPNTFIYQYVGVVFLLILIYSILSYIVLPLLLRLMLIRNLFLTTRQTSTDLINTVSNSYQQLVSLKDPSRNFNLTNSFLINFTSILSGWLNLISATLLTASTQNVTSRSFIFISSHVIDYFILFLLIDLEENE